MPDPTATAVLRGVTKRFGRDVAVDALDLDIAAGEFFSILGPSGCGKTTTLRMLGGFLVPDEGEILLEGRDVTTVPPYRRDVNTVFQSYALFEHLSVADNVAFGLRRRGVPKPEIRRRVGEMLDLVQMSDRAQHRPRQLSGGQRQRIAVARALVNLPRLLLLDEPLGALDLKLRRQMQLELKQIQREVGITFVYVTHDQEEALTMSDRIAVMSGGLLQQCGPPAEIYERPANPFVASFIGTSNLLPGHVVGDAVRVADRLAVPLRSGNGLRDGDRVTVMLRPEKVRLGAVAGGDVGVAADVVDAVYLGATTQLILDAGGLRLVAVAAHGSGAGAPVVRPGDRVDVAWSPDDVLVLHDRHPDFHHHPDHEEQEQA